MINEGQGGGEKDLPGGERAHPGPMTASAQFPCGKGQLLCDVRRLGLGCPLDPNPHERRKRKSRLVTYLLRLDGLIIIVLGRVLLGDGRERPADGPDVRVRQVALPSSVDGRRVDPAVGPLS